MWWAIAGIGFLICAVIAVCAWAACALAGQSDDDDDRYRLIDTDLLP